MTKINTDTMNIDTAIRLEGRTKQLIDSISTMNNYNPILRKKYYPIIIHNIKLLLQYNLILDDYYKDITVILKEV